MIPSKKHISLMQNLMILLSGMLICGLIAVFLGKDLDFDTANYHYYNPYAFLHHRWIKDYWPASNIHAYFSPTADFLSYFLINHFKPIAVVFILGAIHGISFWLLFRITHYFLIDSKYPLFFALVLSFLGMYSAFGLPTLGDFKNDHIISIFILIFVWLQINVLHHYENTKHVSARLIGISGCMLGIAVGLKLTALLYLVGAGMSFILLPIAWTDKLKIIFLFGVFSLCGIGISSGYWMVILWDRFHNPLFPFFNAIFNPAQSSLASWYFTPEQGIPTKIWEKLFYPIYFSFYGPTSDVGTFRDYRFLFVYLLFIIMAGNYLWKKRCILSKFTSSQHKIKLSISWLFLFFIFSYLVDEYCFASIRYIMALEMLAPLILFQLLNQLISNTKLKIISITASLYIIAITLIPNYATTNRAPLYDSSYFNIQLPAFIHNTPDAMILMAYPAYAAQPDPKPQSYLIPFLPDQWHYVGVPFVKEKFHADNNTLIHIRHLIHTYSGNFYLLTTKTNMPELLKTAALLGLTSKHSCSEIRSDRQRLSKEVLICSAVLANPV